MLKRLVIATVAGLLAGCATGPRTLPASPADIAAVRDVEVRNIVWQDELDFAPANRVFANAVATAREDYYRWMDVQHAVRTLLPVIEDVDVRSQLEDALGRGLGEAMAPGRVRVTTTARLPERADRERMRAALQPGAAFVEVKTEYELSVNSLRLEMHSTAEMYVAGRGDPVYANTFYYQSEPIVGSTSATMLWAANNGEPYHRAVAEGVGEIARMIALDIAPSKTVPATTKKMTLALANGSTRTPDVTGTVLRQRPGRIVLRADEGGLYSFAR